MHHNPRAQTLHLRNDYNLLSFPLGVEQLHARSSRKLWQIGDHYVAFFDVFQISLNKAQGGNAVPPAGLVSLVEHSFATPRIHRFVTHLFADFPDDFAIGLLGFHAENRTRDEHFLHSRNQGIKRSRLIFSFSKSLKLSPQVREAPASSQRYLWEASRFDRGKRKQ